MFADGGARGRACLQDFDYRNQIYWDGQLHNTTGSRPRMPLDLMRYHRWEEALFVARDNGDVVHNLTLVLNSQTVLAARSLLRELFMYLCDFGFKRKRGCRMHWVWEWSCFFA